MTAQDPYEPLPPQVGFGPVGKGVTAAAVAGLTASTGPLAPFISGAFVAIEAHGKKLRDKVAERDLGLFTAASEQAKLPVEQTIQKIAEDDRLLILSGIAMDAARRTPMKEKARMLGRCIGSIIDDDALVDPESIWVDIIAAVEPVHIRVLMHFVTHIPDKETGVQVWHRGPKRNLKNAARITGLGDLVLPLAQDLVQVGLLQVPPEFDGGSPSTSPLVISSVRTTDAEFRATSLAIEFLRRIEEEGVDLLTS